MASSCCLKLIHKRFDLLLPIHIKRYKNTWYKVIIEATDIMIDLITASHT